MSSSQSREVRRFFRATEERFKEAQFLLKHDFTTAAVYLAGYAVECALKALILSSEPASRHQDTLGSFRGAKAHDFDWLRNELQRRKVPLPQMILRQLKNLTWWTTDLRYKPGQTNEEAATDFLTTADSLAHWVKGKL